MENLYVFQVVRFDEYGLALFSNFSFSTAKKAKAFVNSRYDKVVIHPRIINGKTLHIIQYKHDLSNKVAIIKCKVF